MLDSLRYYLAHEWQVTRTRPHLATLSLMFVLLLIVLFSFALGADLRLLRQVGSAILWISILLSILLNLPYLFQKEKEEGALDMIKLLALPLEVFVFIKCCLHWVQNVLPLLLLAPIFALMLDLPPREIFTLSLSLFLGSPALTFLGALGAGLTLSLRQGEMILAILVLPFTIPTLIFGISATHFLSSSHPLGGTALALISLLSLTTAILTPAAIAAAIKYA